MKSKFGKKTSYRDSGSTMKIIKDIVGMILLIVFGALLLVFLRSLSVDFVPAISLPLAMGMLGNPFRTTRRMSVPFKSRVGHRERTFIKFGKFCIGVGIGMLLLYLIVSAIEIVTRGI